MEDKEKKEEKSFDLKICTEAIKSTCQFAAVILLIIILSEVQKVNNHLVGINLSSKTTERLMTELMRNTPNGHEAIEQELTYRNLKRDQLANILINSKYENDYFARTLMFKKNIETNDLVLALDSARGDEVKKDLVNAIIFRTELVSDLKQMAHYENLNENHKKEIERRLKK